MDLHGKTTVKKLLILIGPTVILIYIQYRLQGARQQKYAEGKADLIKEIMILLIPTMGNSLPGQVYTDESSIPVNQINKQIPVVESARETNFSLEQNFPNPFTSDTKIGFHINKPSHVVLCVYNISGQKVKTLTDTDYTEGYYNINWDGKDENNKVLPSGIYLYRLQSRNNTQTRKMYLYH